MESVVLGGSQWTSSFLSHLSSAGLGSGGYAVPAGSDQLLAVPWNNIDQVTLRFDQDVSVDINDLSVTGVTTAQRLPSSFSYNATSHAATWTFASPLENDRLLLDLDSNGVDPVKNSSGKLLDGDWTSGSSAFKSGNGQEGGDFEFRVNILPADANRSGSVGGSDYTLVADASGTSAGQGGYTAYYDINGSGSIDASDVSVVSALYGDALPGGNPAGLSNDAPTAAASRSVSVIEDAADYVFSLWGDFADSETSDSSLSYQLTSNTNPSLFASTSINASSGTMTLDFAADAYGTAVLQVQATDGGGLVVNKRIDVGVDSDNDAPRIDDFGASGSFPTYVITGRVVDENPGGRTIQFGGLLNGQSTTTNADGTFSFPVTLSGAGTISAQTTDPQGASSTPVFVIITQIVADPHPRLEVRSLDALARTPLRDAMRYDDLAPGSPQNHPRARLRDTAREASPGGSAAARDSWSAGDRAKSYRQIDVESLGTNALHIDPVF